MKAYDFDAVVYDGEIYCVGCLPEGVDADSEEVDPIFASSEWEYVPICDHCGCAHDYVTVLGPEEELDEDDECTPGREE